MIDEDGYRLNVAMILSNAEGKVLIAKRSGMNAWQFPQGGLLPNETPDQALFRELKEEIGLTETDVKILGFTKDWLRYRLPKRYIRTHSLPLCIGQKQKWYMLKLLTEENKISLLHCNPPEFEAWRWVDYWYPLKEVVSFKKDVYRQALLELSPLLKKASNKPKDEESKV